MLFCAHGQNRGRRTRFLMGITQGKTLVILLRKRRRWASLSAMTDRGVGIVG
jgi:hypothetical protein